MPRTVQWSFQYGQVIKLPLQILPSIHGQPYGIDQSATIDQSDYFDATFSQLFLVNLLLDPIGMLIP